MAKKTIQFSALREDLVFKRADSLQDMFHFGAMGEPSLDSTPGPRMQESFGFDFQSECKPVLRIIPISQDIKELVGQPISDFQINIMILDIGLNIRELIFQEDISDIKEPLNKKIDLTDFSHLAFSRGFTIQCSVSRKSTLEKTHDVLWHKSQVIFTKDFTVKSSNDEALFEISWVELTDPSEASNLLMWVEWESSEVSQVPDTQCFTVKANDRLKYAFKRLENNSMFGHLTVRILFVQVMNELISKCLIYCDTNKEPAEGSLHEKLRPMFKKLDYSFEDVAHQMQSSVEMQKLDASALTLKIAQQIAQVGSTLDAIKFGGFRQ